MGGGEQGGVSPAMSKQMMDSTAGPGNMIRTGMIVATYLGLNSSLNLLNRYTLGHAGFRYPVSLTCFHLVFQLCSLAPLLLRPPYAGTHTETVSRSWKSVVAIGAFMSLNIGLNNASLLHLSLSFNQVIRASIPVVCAFCAIFVENKVPTPSEVRNIIGLHCRGGDSHLRGWSGSREDWGERVLMIHVKLWMYHR